MQHASDMVPFVCHPKRFIDDLSDPGCAPKVRAVSTGPCPLEQQSSEFFLLACIQTRRTARRGAHLVDHVPFAVALVPPAHNGIGRTAQTAGDCVEA